MSNLWIVHRNPQRRSALARIAGRADGEVVSGGPLEADFEERAAPAAVLLGLEGDFERELEFVHRMHAKLLGARILLLVEPEDAAEAERLFSVVEPEILESLPSPRILRARLAVAFARRRAESLAQRRNRQRIADRFATWFGGIEIRGLLRALDPSLGHLPLLVRGVPGSGRALVARYVELFRASAMAPGAGDPDATLRVHASEIANLGELARRIARHAESSRNDAAGVALTGGDETSARRNVWIDDIDRLSISTQNALAEWIVHESAPGAIALDRPRWIATAGAARWQDPLEPSLVRAFSPLVIEIPSLADAPDALPAFATQIAQAWSRSVGGPERRLGTAALAELARQTWPGDRAEVEAALRDALAATNRSPLEPEDLDLASSVSDRDRPGPPSERGEPDIPVVDAVFDETEDGTPDRDAAESITSGAVRPIEDDGEEARLLDVDELTADEPAQEARWPSREAGLENLEAVDAQIEGFTQRFDDPTRPDESVSLAEASFDLADSEEISAEARRAAEQPGEEALDPRLDARLDASWRDLARSLSHEIRNPLVSIKTFTELLPEHYADETFRARFADLVGRDVAHIDEVVTRMQEVAEHDPTALEAVDVSALIEGLLEERRGRIAEHRLLVLRELEREAPLAWAEPTSLRVAIEGLIDRALDALPERGDLFVATRHVPRGQDGEPRLRVLLRHHNPDGVARPPAGLDELRPEANLLEYVLAETVARASGGSLTVDASDAHESLILLELRTPN